MAAAQETINNANNIRQLQTGNAAFRFNVFSQSNETSNSLLANGAAETRAT
jgi:hypothetical protein